MCILLGVVLPCLFWLFVSEKFLSFSSAGLELFMGGYGSYCSCCGIERNNAAIVACGTLTAFVSSVESRERIRQTEHFEDNKWSEKGIKGKWLFPILLLCVIKLSKERSV